MKVLLATVSALALALNVTPSAKAARTIDLHANTAGELARMCAARAVNGRNDAEINFCHGFAQGEVDTLMHFAAKSFCLPRPMPTRTETLAQFVHWAESDPKHAGQPAAAGFYNFLRDRYPCNG